MKNISTSLSFSLCGAITFFITTAVFLAGFAGAEIMPGYRTNDHPQGVGKEMVEEDHSPGQAKIVNSRQQSSNSRGDDDELSEQTNFANIFRNLQGEGNFGRQMKRHSENLRKELAAERESEAENDGYVYDDDDYYHFDIKREGDQGGRTNEALESEKKDSLVNNKHGNLNNKVKNDKEEETIELLNFSQTHMKNGASDPSQNVLKNFQDKGTQSYSQSDSIKMNDLKENSGISEKVKDTKEESGAPVNSDQKIVQQKKEDASTQEKDTSKFKESKVENDSEKKESDASVKGNSDSLTSKNIKENAKNAESNKAKVECDTKPAKLKSDINVGACDTSEKSNMKESENTKLVKDEKDNPKLVKLNSEEASKSEISQNENKATLMSNDFKESGKLLGLEEEDKESEEMSDKNMGLRYYRGGTKLRKEADEMAKNFEVINEKQRNLEGISRSKGRDVFSFPIAFEIKTENAKESSYKGQDQVKAQEMQRMDQPVKTSFRFNFPPSDLENTEYHKNFIKSLRRYKGLEESTKPAKDNYSPLLMRSYYYPSFVARGNQPLLKKSKIKKRKSKKECSVGSENYNAAEAKKKSRSTETVLTQDTSKQEPENKSSLITKKNVKKENSNRRRRKSPQKFEYKIKIINEPTAKNLGSSSSDGKRKKKETKSKIIEKKSGKKSSYSQVLLEDLTKLRDHKDDRSLKRRGSVWFGDGQFKSSDEGEQGIFRLKGMPSGYYTNRVKFGNKHFLRNEETQVASRIFRNADQLHENNSPMKETEGSFQCSWGTPKLQESLKHGPQKRFSGNNIFNSGRGNSLLLIKKGRNGERITKTFTDETKDDTQKSPESEELARILSQDSDYIVLKKTDNNRYQKISLDNIKDDYSSAREFRSVGGPDKKSFLSGIVQDSTNSGRKTLTRLHRSSDQKTHNPNTISTSLKKTFEKFKDLADFFKDSEQETQENQQQTQELKEASDIVFSEDKLPDPLVINNEVEEKNPKLKSQNSITSISTNFKQLDQDKKDSCKDIFMDSKETAALKPALKNAFPEAKSISSVMKDGKEIILIDLNKNELMMNHKGHNVLGSSCGSSERMSKPLIIPGNRQVEIIWNPNPTFSDQAGAKNVLDKKYPLDKTFDRGNKFPDQETKAAYSGQPLVTMPLNDLAQLSILLKQLNEKKEGISDGHNKIIRKKSAPTTPNIKTSSNIAQFLEDYRKLSEINNEQLPKKISVAKKRHSNYLFRAYPELSSSSDSNEKDVRDFLESAGAKENKRSGAENEESRQGFKGWESEDRRSDIRFSNSETYDSNVSPRRQGQWSSAKENRYYSPFKSTWNEYSPNYLKSNLGTILQIDEKQDNANEKDYQDELLEELSEASNKIERLRREGADDQSLRKTMENALPFKAAAVAAAKSESNEKEKATAISGSKLTSEDLKNSNANLNERDSKKKDSDAAPSSAGNEELTSNTKKESGKDLQEESYVKEIHENKPEPLQKNDDKNQLKELVESKNSDNFDLSELVGGEKEEGGASGRRENERNPIRRKRSSEAKVSTTEVENTILSNFTEDNYQSVYSPGIKRKLLSIDDGEDDGDSKEERNGENVSESICVKNVAPDCSDHALTNCLHEQEAQNDTNRTKRSLMNNYHSNHKREIDLDESMPNDFQNFLETSLGLDSHVPSIGGQKRETFEKKEEKRENKETVRGKNDVPVADVPSSEKDKEKESPLEKREVSEADDRKQKSYKKRTPNFEYDTKMGKITSPAAKTTNSLGRVKDKPDVKLASLESESEKFPTRIRIQITKDTTKDINKSEQKPILDENDITSNEMENPSNEKKFSEKSKFYSKSDGENLYSTSIFKNPYSSDYGYDESDTESGKQKYYMIAHPPLRKKKKRKFIQENVYISSPDVQISQKMKEGLIRKYMSDRNLYDATTQRVPVSNHLPQVETVYNPTQGANKAQVEGCGLTLKENKDVNSKNSLEHQDDTSVINDKVLKFYVNSKQDTQVKNIKDEPKDLEILEWKPYSRKMKLRQDSDQSSAQNPSYKGLGVESSYSGLNSGSMSRKSISQLKQSQKPYSSYLSISPADVVMSSESVKPDLIWNALTKNAVNSKLWKDSSNNYDVQNGKDSPSYNGGKLDDTSWKEYNNYYMNKNPKTYKFRNYISSSVMNALSDKSLNSHKYYKSLQDNTVNEGDSSGTIDNLKDSDYLDNIEDPYGDSDDVKQESQMEDDDHGKKESKLLTGYKALDEENTSIGNGGEELEEDYEGNNEEDADDYSLLSSEKSENAHVQQENDKNFNSYRSIEPLYSSPHRHKANKLQQSRSGLNRGGLKTTKKDDKLNMNSASASYADSTKEEDSPLNSMNVLKMANENSNVLGKNLMKNLQQYNYDSNLKNEDIFSNENNYFRGFKYPSLREKEKLDLKNVNWRSKFKRNHGPSKVGDRYFYAAKTETFDLKDFEPKKYASFKKNVRCGHYQLPKSNPLSAQLRGMENEYEYESEDNNKYFGENLLDSGKGNLAKQGRHFKSSDSGGYFNDNEKIKRNSPDKTDTAKENLRDNDENISEDGVLENVIGKYIMRKSVKVNEDKKVRNNGFEPVGIDKKKLESSSDELNRHKPQKRSVANGPYFLNLKNNRGKRFSAGHLTENNYRKFHKKNSRKRRLIEKDSINLGERKTVNDRSRFDRSVFRKLSKEKEAKKLDLPDSKTAGFEPILWDSRGDNARNAKQEAASKFEKLYTRYNANRQSLGEKLKFDEGVKENSRNGEKSFKSQVQGPWKIRLNEKNTKVSEQGSKQSKIRFGQSPVKRENTGEEKEDTLTPNAIQAYLLIRDNVGVAENDKRSHEDDLPPTSGAEADKEVGNSYRVFHEGGEETPRKRSGRSSSPKDRPIASAAEAAENSISLEKISKDLEKGKNLFEGDSKAGAPFDDKKNANFVNVQGQRLRFDDKNKILSNGRLRKSIVLPLSTDANIIGDSRHINEETSKNLGQQIVDAILTHVSTNPRFKQVIAPGLSGKSPTYRQTIKTGKTPTKIKYPDQVQSFLQTIMRHMEKMAENDVKKRMCNKIDRQSKDFLRSMLEFPEITEPRSCKQQKGFFVDPPCADMCSKAVTPPKVPPVDVMSTTPYSSLPPIPVPPPFPIGSNCGPALKASICEALKKKKEVLKKLIEDYQRLSELEREAINISFQFLVAQLEDTEQLLEFLNGCGECYHPPDCPPTENTFPTSTEHPCCPNQEGQATLPYITSQPSAPVLPNNPNIPQLTQKNYSHVFHFEPVDGCPIHNITPEAETPHPQTTTMNPCCMNENSDGGFEKVASSNEPQSFDLLPNHPNITNPKPAEGGIRSRNIDKTESARVKEPSPKGQQSAVNIQKIPTSVSEVVASPKQNELHKLGIGDAAGLQMAHNSRSPWVSNLDVAKQSKLTNQNAFVKPGNSVSPNVVKNYRSSGKGDSDSAGKDSKNTKIRLSKDRLVLSGSGEAKTNSRLDGPKRQFSINRLSDESGLEIENSGTVKNIRKKRRTMRYNVRKKNKRNIIDKKLFKLIKKKKVTSEYEEDPEMEYLIWASMPAVRRRLNDLEQGIEVDKNSAQLLLGNMGSERAEKDDKENSDRIKLLGLRK